MKIRALPKPAIALATAALALVDAPALAGVVTFDYAIEFSGGASPEGPVPWLRATFTDVDGSVTLDLTALNLSGTEFVSKWLFNLDPALDPDSLSIAYEDGVVPDSIETEMDDLHGAGGTRFDVLFSFPTSHGPGRFDAGDHSTFLITWTGLGSPLSASSFSFLTSEHGLGPLLSAAHVQGIGEADDSGWVAPSEETPVPEPGTLLLLGTSLLGVARYVRRRTGGR